MRIPPLKTKIMLESNPPKSRILVRRLAVGVPPAQPPPPDRSATRARGGGHRRPPRRCCRGAGPGPQPRNQGGSNSSGKNLRVEESRGFPLRVGSSPIRSNRRLGSSPRNSPFSLRESGVRGTLFFDAVSDHALSSEGCSFLQWCFGPLAPEKLTASIPKKRVPRARSMSRR